jgi:soluble cytochrome b562
MKSLTIIIAALVGTLILNGPIQSYADPQLDTLVNIATQARDSLNISISQIPNVPDKITSLYKQGSNETDALTQAANKQDIASAKQHFLSAMNFFKITNDAINSFNATEVNDQQRVDVIQLQSEITRLEKITETLQTIAITNHVDFNFTQLNTSIQNAKQALDAGNVPTASKLIDSANQLIVDAHQSLSETAQQMTTNRAKDFTEKQIERYDKINDLNATENPVIQQTSNVTVSNTSSNLTSTENPGEMIAKLRKLVSEGNVDEALKVIKSLDAYQKRTLKNNTSQMESQTSVNEQNNTETNSIPITNSSNITTMNSEITHTSNTTTASSIKMNSFNNENSNFSFTNPSNVTTSNFVKPDSFNNNTSQQENDKIHNKPDFFNNSNSSQSNNNGKISFFRDSNFNQQGKDNKTESQVISQGSFDSEQQDKTHGQKNHEKISQPKNEKRNHD